MDPSDKQATAMAVWRRMAELSFMNAQRMKGHALLRKQGLTPGHFRMLMVLDTEVTQPMKNLAEAMHCDASFVTMLVDGLEENRLVKRVPSESDRRVKHIQLTAAGSRARERLFDEIFAVPDELLELSDSDLRTLARIMRKLPDSPIGFGGPPAD